MRVCIRNTAQAQAMIRLRFQRWLRHWMESPPNSLLQACYLRSGREGVSKLHEKQTRLSLSIESVLPMAKGRVLLRVE